MAKDKMNIALKKVRTPTFRLSFPHLDAPTAMEEGQEKKYRCTMLFPKDTDLSALKKAGQNAMVEALGKEKAVTTWKALMSGKTQMNNPFRNGAIEKPDFAGYEDSIFVAASCKNQPAVVGPNRQAFPIEKIKEKVYAGCYCQAVLIAFWFESGKKGLSFALQGIQKVKDGEPFGSSFNAEEEFEELETNDGGFDSGVETENGDDSNSDDLGF